MHSRTQTRMAEELQPFVYNFIHYDFVDRSMDFSIDLLAKYVQAYSFMLCPNNTLILNLKDDFEDTWMP